MLLWIVSENTVQPRPGSLSSLVFVFRLSRGAKKAGVLLGPLNGLGHSLRLRVQILGVELFYRGVPFAQSVYPVWPISKHVCGEVNRIGQTERLDGNIGNTGLRGETRRDGPVRQSDQTLQSYCTF